MAVVKLPRIFQQKQIPNIATNDPHLAAIIMVQAALSAFTEEQQQFIVDTVVKNMELHRRYTGKHAFEGDE